MKKYYWFIGCLLMVNLSYSQEIRYNLIDTSYRYFLGTENLPENWNSIDFIDSTWIIGEGEIGFGDVTYNPYYDTSYDRGGLANLNIGDTIIHTITPNTSCIYTRYSFSLNSVDTTLIKGLILEIYYDDGFIAYLNGIEFARANMGTKENIADNNTLALRSHESAISRGDYYPIPGYFINKKLIHNYLVEGENILAVEVHNDSINGSDMFLKTGLYTAMKDTVYQPLPDFWQIRSLDEITGKRAKSYVELDSSKLPIIIVETDEYGIPFSHIEVIAHMKIINNNTNLYNFPNDEPNDYNGRIKIEIRGESSSYFPKQSFNIETQNADGSNNNIALLGMPNENDWILYGPISDKSLIQNALMYKLGRKQGHYASRTKYCELILNGEYLGLYLLMEKIKPDNNRLNIAKLKPSDLAGDSLTGGYIFWKSNTLPTIIYYPKETKIEQEQKDYIENYVSEYYSLLYSDLWLDPEKGYRNYIDTESLIDYVILNEFSYDIDKYSNSTFMYKDRNDNNPLIKFGPLWDYNYAFGNTLASSFNKWIFNDEHDNDFSRYFQDTAIVKRMSERWFELRETILNIDSIYATIDSLIEYINESRIRNDMVWEPYKHINIYLANYATDDNYSDIINSLKTWIKNRVEWIDENIDKIYYPLVIYNTENILTLIINNDYLNVYPNPFIDKTTIQYKILTTSFVQICIYNMNGQLINYINIGEQMAGTYEYQWNATSADGSRLPGGIYFYKIIFKNSQGIFETSNKIMLLE